MKNCYKRYSNFEENRYILFNANRKNLTFKYKNIEEAVLENNCNDKCPRQCKQIYRKLHIETKDNNIDGDTFINFKFKPLQQMTYQSEPVKEFLEFIADFGGLFGLYVGLSLIDISKLFDILNMISRKLLRYILFLRDTKIIIILKNYLFEFKFMLIYMKNIKWKKLITIISTPILFYQIISLMITYLEYPTQTLYEFIEYNKNGSQFLINDLPAITLCNENIFEQQCYGEYYNHDTFEKILHIANTVELH